MATRPSQIDNRNFLAPVGFKFNLKRSPGVAFFCNSANIPDLNLGVANQPNYLRDIPVPGDKVDFGDLSLRFLVDEDLTNFMEIQKWILHINIRISLATKVFISFMSYIFSLLLCFFSQ